MRRSEGRIDGAGAGVSVPKGAERIDLGRAQPRPPTVRAFRWRAGTSRPCPKPEWRYFEHQELRLMVEAGLTPAQALFAATGDAPRALGHSGVGRRETGAWADFFLVLNADPLAAIRNTRAIEAVRVAGNRVPSKP